MASENAAYVGRIHKNRPHVHEAKHADLHVLMVDKPCICLGLPMSSERRSLAFHAIGGGRMRARLVDAIDVGRRR
jgi:hypothetical protein